MKVKFEGKYLYKWLFAVIMLTLILTALNGEGVLSSEISAIRSLKGSIEAAEDRRGNLLPENFNLKQREVAPEELQQFYPQFKWVCGSKLIPLSKPPLIYKGEVFIEQDDFWRMLKILGIREWSLEKVKEYPDGRVIARFTYEDIPPKRYRFEPLFYNGVYIPFDTVRKTVGYEIVIDEENSRIWIIPSLQDIIVTKDAVVLKFAGPLKIYRSFYLRDPLRFVIDIENAAVTKDLFREMELSNHPYLKGIRTSQFTIVPPIARVVLDLKEGAKITRIARIKVNEIHLAFSEEYEATLVTPKENPTPSSSEKPIKIFQVTPQRSGSLASIILKVDRADKISYSLKKLKDGRIYIDLYNAVLTVSKNVLPVKYGHVLKIKYSQYQRKPVPIVRVVIYPDTDGELRLRERTNTKLFFSFIPSGYDLAEGVKPLPNLKGKKVCLDPGHGGSDPGAKSPFINLDEKDITLSIAKMVASDLKEMGVKVIMTRYSDTDVLSAEASDVQELQARVDIAKRAKAYVFVSIHINASPNSYLDGIMTFYHKDIDYPLAYAIHTQLVRLNLFRDRGIRKANFYVIRKSPMPAVLLELGFLSNKNDALKLASLSVRRRLAKAIAIGIANYLSGKVSTIY